MHKNYQERKAATRQREAACSPCYSWRLCHGAFCPLSITLACPLPRFFKEILHVNSPADFLLINGPLSD